jgi:hypothetical protein
MHMGNWIDRSSMHAIRVGMHLVWEPGFWLVVRCGNLLLQIMIDKLITMS